MLYWLVPLYLLIGIFIFGVTKKAAPDSMQDGAGFCIFITVFAWPAFLSVLAVVCLCLAILNLGEHVGEWLNKFLDSI